MGNQVEPESRILNQAYLDSSHGVQMDECHLELGQFDRSFFVSLEMMHYPQSMGSNNELRLRDIPERWCGR